MKSLEALQKANTNAGVAIIEHLTREQNNGVDPGLVLSEGERIKLPNPLVFGKVPIRGGGEYEALLEVEVIGVNGESRFINLTAAFIEKPIFPAKIADNGLVIRTTEQPVHHTGAVYDIYRSAEGEVGSCEKGWQAIADQCPNGFRIGKAEPMECTVYDRRTGTTSTSKTRKQSQFRLDKVA